MVSPAPGSVPLESKLTVRGAEPDEGLMVKTTDGSGQESMVGVGVGVGVVGLTVMVVVTGTLF